jgi:hypothetical protein
VIATRAAAAHHRGQISALAVVRAEVPIDGVGEWQVVLVEHVVQGESEVGHGLPLPKIRAFNPVGKLPQSYGGVCVGIGGYEGEGVADEGRRLREAVTAVAVVVGICIGLQRSSPNCLPSDGRRRPPRPGIQPGAVKLHT